MTALPARSWSPGRACLLAAALLSLTCGCQPAWAGEPRRVIAVVPMGKVDAQRLALVAEALRGAYDADTRIEPSRELPPDAYWAPRKRWRAEKLLRSVERDFPEGAWKAVLVTEAEISTTKEKIEDWGIGGLGIIGGRTCVVSTFLIRRHSPERAKLDERLRKLAVHELGHTLGLDHCDVFACVMRDARGKLISSLDGTQETFCGRCRSVVKRAE